MILNAAAALLGGATLALAAFDPRLLAGRRERDATAVAEGRTNTATTGTVAAAR